MEGKKEYMTKENQVLPDIFKDDGTVGELFNLTKDK